MREYLKFYINGAWVDPVSPKTLDVTDPATAKVCGKISLGSAADVDKAVKAAAKAFRSWSRTTREQRLATLDRIIEYRKYKAPIHLFQPGIVHPPLLVLLVLALLQTPMPLNPA